MEALRDQRGLPWLEDLTRDLRFGFRQLVRSPIFSLFAGTSLALGIGAAVAIFSLFDSIVLRQLPVPHPEQLVVASFGGPGGNFNYSLPYPQFDEIRRRNTTLSGVFAMSPFGRVTVGVRGEAAIAEGLQITGDYYRVLGLAPSTGRLIEPSDDRPGGTVAVLSHAYWQRRFGGRLDVIGATVTLNNVPFTIVGVEPVGFWGAEIGRPYDISVPMRAREVSEPLWDEAFSTWIYVIGRLKPGITLEQAEPEIKTIFARVSMNAAQGATQVRAARENQLRLEPAATGAASDLRQTHERWLRLLLMVLSAVLLLASLNVATLLLSRSDARHREISTRLALGAGRARSPAAPHRVNGARDLRGCRGFRARVVGQSTTATDGRAHERSIARGAGTESAVDCFHVRRVGRHVRAVRAHSGAARHMAAAFTDRPPSGRRPSPSWDRSDTCRDPGGIVTYLASRCRPVSSHARAALGAGDRL